MDTAFVSFRCSSCKTEIEASPDMIGQGAECPACGARITIPGPDAEHVIRHSGNDDPDACNVMKSRTIRIELSDL